MHLRALRNGAIAAVLTAVVGLSLNALVSDDGSKVAERSTSPRPSASPACRAAAERVDRVSLRGVTGRFEDVWFGGPRHAWAIGSEGEDDSATKPVLAEWNADTWDPWPGASDLGTGALLGIDGERGPDGDDAWAVGWSTDGFGRDTLAAHFDGTAWGATTPVPDGQLSDVRVLAPDDVWAVGSLGNPEIVDERAAVLHWNGSSWTQMQVPAGGGRSGLVSMAGTTDDLWAAGYHHLGALVLHYDGSSWEEVDLPKGTGPMNAVAVSDATVWAVGDGVFRGDTSSMKEVVGAPKGASFADVAPRSRGAAFAVGSISRGDRQRSIAMAIDGSTKQPVAVKAPRDDALETVAKVRGDTWTAGWHETPKGTAPLVATLTSCV